VIADGVYFPATGKTHCVGCTRDEQHFPDFLNYANEIPLTPQEFVSSSPPTDSIDVVQVYYWIDPDRYYHPPLNLSTLEDCHLSNAAIPTIELSLEHG
jgi:hypothetical protein